MDLTQTLSGAARSQAYSGFSRPAFFQGQVLAPGDLNAAVDYSREKLLMLLRHLVGAGLAGGLEVRPASPAGARVIVTPGYGVDGNGRDLYLRSPADLDMTPLIQAAARSAEPLTYEVRIRAGESAEYRSPAGGPWLPDGGGLAVARTLEGVVLEAVPVILTAADPGAVGLRPPAQLILLGDRPRSVTADGSNMVITGESQVLIYDAARLTLKLQSMATVGRTQMVTKQGTVALDPDSGQLLVDDQPVPGLPPVADALFSPSGEQIFLALPGSNAVGVLDSRTLKLTGVLPAGRGPAQLLLHPTVPYLFAINHGSADVTVYHLATGRIAATLTAPAEPVTAAFDPYGRLWIPGRADSTVLVADLTASLGAASAAAPAPDYLPLARIHLEPNQLAISAEHIDSNVRDAYRLTTLAQLSQAAGGNATHG